MPRLTCPRCSRVFNYTGKRTSPPCPRCDYHVGVGGSPTGRDLNDDGDEVESDGVDGGTTQTQLITDGGRDRGSALTVPDLVSTSPAQVLRGEPVAAGGKTICTYCSQPVHEGETVLVHAYRGPRDPEWLVTRLYCSACEGDLIELELPTIVGSTELLARARLMLTSGPDMNAYLALTAVEILDQSHGDSASNGRVEGEHERESDQEQETTATEDDDPSP